MLLTIIIGLRMKFVGIKTTTGNNIFPCCTSEPYKPNKVRDKDNILWGSQYIPIEEREDGCFKAILFVVNFSSSFMLIDCVVRDQQKTPCYRFHFVSVRSGGGVLYAYSN